MFIYFIYVAGGGAFGASLRFFVQSISKLYFPNFPVGTLIVNIIGSFLIGLLANYLNSKEISELFYKYFIIIGLLGSFTTFSAFSIETIEHFDNMMINTKTYNIKLIDIDEISRDQFSSTKEEMEHFEDISGLFLEQMRVLKYGGIMLCYIVPKNPDNLVNLHHT